MTAKGRLTGNPETGTTLDRRSIRLGGTTVSRQQ